MKRRGRPIRGAFSGLILGALGVVNLSLFGVRAPDDVTVIGLPVAGLVLGIALGMWAPFGGRRVAQVAAPPPLPPAPVPPPPQAPGPPPPQDTGPDPWVARDDDPLNEER